MGNARPVTKKCWLKFLKAHGCRFESFGKHEKWKCPGCFQSIMFRAADKEIPFAHVQTNLMTMGVPKAKFWDWIDKNC